MLYNNMIVAQDICWGLRFSKVDSLALSCSDSRRGWHKIKSESERNFDSSNKDTLSERSRLYLGRSEQRYEAIIGYRYALEWVQLKDESTEGRLFQSLVIHIK